MHNFLKNLLNLLFPPKCLTCREFCDDKICQKCLASFVYLNKFFTVQNENVFSILLYDDKVKKMITQFKFNKKISLQTLMAEIIKQNFPKQFIDFEIILTVPLSQKRFQQRGFNQVDLIFDALALKFNKAINKTTLKRVKDTRPLFSMNQPERQKELLNAFKIEDETSLKSKKILLVDDIITTGSTVKEIIRLLKKAEVKSIYVLSLAKAI